MTAHRRCHYCGWRGAKVRRAGEPPTCYACRDLPKRDAELELEVEAELERYYAGENEHRR